MENREFLSANTIVPNIQGFQDIQDQDIQDDVPFILETAGTSINASVSNNVLTIEGTNNDDWVQVHQNSNNFTIYVSASYGNSFTQLGSTFSGIPSIVFNGYDGDDTFKALYSDVYVTVGCTINGGNGNDDLTGGSGSNIFNGGNGNDLIIGGTGTNIFHNTGTGSSVFLWRSKSNGDSWASGSSIASTASGKDDANLVFVNTSTINSYHYQAWTDTHLFNVVDTIRYTYNLLGNYKYFCTASQNKTEMLLVPAGDLGGPSSGGIYTGMNYGAGNAIILDNRYTADRSLVVHEFAHNWHHSSYYQQLASISWNGNSKKSGSKTGDFARDYGATNPLEDWTTTFEVVLAGQFAVSNVTDKWFQKDAIVRNFLNNIGEVKIWGSSEIVVTTNAEPVKYQNGIVSLRNAVFYAGLNTTIKFADSLQNQTVSIGNNPLTVQKKGIVIDGTNNNITINTGSEGFKIETGGDLTFRNLTLTGGSGIRVGLIFGKLSLINVVVTGNTASESLFNVQSVGSMLVMNSTIAGNKLSGNFGIILVHGTAEITNSLIIGNDNYPLNVQANSKLTVNNSNIVGNTGFIVVWSDLIINNSIVAFNNSGGDNFSLQTGGKVKINASLISYLSSTTKITIDSDSLYSTNIANKIDPKFATFANYTVGAWTTNLWKTWDLHLIENQSPALGTGKIALVPVGVTKDKEGNARHNRGAVDMGAYQHPYVIGDLPSEFGSTVSASGVTTNAVTITWTKPSKEYKVTGNKYTAWLKIGTEWTEIETTTKTAVTVTGLAAGTNYDYMVTATINNIPEVILVSGTFKTQQSGDGINISVGAVTEVKTTVASKTQIGTSKVDAVKITWKAPANYSGGFVVAIIKVDSGTNTPQTGATTIEINVKPGAKLETFIPHSQLTQATRYQVIVRADNTYSIISTPTYFNFGNTKDPVPVPISGSSGVSTSAKIAPPKKSNNTNIVTATSAKVFWNDSETSGIPLQYKVLVYDVNKALIDYAYVAAGTKEFSITEILTPKSKYTVEIYAVAAAGKSNEKLSSKLSISVTTNDYPASTVKVDSKQITIVSAKGLTITEPKNIPAGTILNHYIEYTDVVDAKGKPDWNAAVVEQITNKTQPFDLAAQLNPNTQYFVRIVTINAADFATATQTVYGKETKFKTATVPLATFIKSGFALDSSYNYGIKLGIQSPAQNDSKKMLPTSPDTSFQYQLFVADDKAKIDKTTGILTGAKDLGNITVTPVNDPRKPYFASNIILLSNIASALDNLTQLKSIQIQLVVTYTNSSLSGIFATLPIKPLKFSMPKWS
ncbi:MAG: fibronectin type III domain-containing protein [Planctomycetaceae bacterium]|nr:fibronectin type III domain-containing protein [Planctomycetaceae bacterium]